MRRLLFVAAMLMLSSCAWSAASGADLGADTQPANASTDGAHDTPSDRLPPVELTSFSPNCASSTRPQLIDGDPSPEDLEWANEVGPIMGWAPEDAIRRVRFEGILDRQAMNVLYESDRYAGIALSTTQPPFLGYTILTGDAPPSAQLQQLFCRVPQLQVRLGADHSEPEIIAAMDRLRNDAFGGTSWIAGAGLDLDGNGIFLDVTDRDAFEAAVAAIEADIGVRISDVRFLRPLRIDYRPVRVIEVSVREDDRTLLVAGDTCSAHELLVTEFTDRVEIEFIAEIRSGGGGQQLDCASGLSFELERPLGDRPLLAATTGEPLPLPIRERVQGRTWRLRSVNGETIDGYDASTIEFREDWIEVNDGCEIGSGQVVWFGLNSFFIAVADERQERSCASSLAPLHQYFRQSATYEVELDLDGATPVLRLTGIDTIMTFDSAA